MMFSCLWNKTRSGSAEYMNQAPLLSAKSRSVMLASFFVVVHNSLLERFIKGLFINASQSWLEQKCNLFSRFNLLNCWYRGKLLIEEESWLGLWNQVWSIILSSETNIKTTKTPCSVRTYYFYSEHQGQPLWCGINLSDSQILPLSELFKSKPSSVTSIFLVTFCSTLPNSLWRFFQCCSLSVVLFVGRFLSPIGSTCQEAHGLQIFPRWTVSESPMESYEPLLSLRPHMEQASAFMLFKGKHLTP